MGFNLNRELITSDNLQLPVLNNGSFWYGDGFFDAMRYSDDRIHFVKHHWDRLVQSCHVLNIANPFGDIHDFADNVKLLADLNPGQAQRMKLVIWRHAREGYKRMDQEAEFLITSSPLPQNSYDLNISGLSIVIYRDHLKSTSALGNVKTTSSALYVLATQFAQSQNFDDAVILNCFGRPVETAKMNMYMIQGDSLITPGLQEGCLDGIMRRVIMDLCHQNGLEIVQGNIEISDLESANGILLSSAIQGIQWANKVNAVSFPMPEMVVKLNDWLNAAY